MRFNDSSPDPQLIRSQMARILAGGPFVNSDRVARFLTHVVDSSLEGRPSDLKESSIGVAVFDRGPSYDPKLDPIVRVEARRLRVKLDQYYAAEGKDDPVVIMVPKGRATPRSSRCGRRRRRKRQRPIRSHRIRSSLKRSPAGRNLAAFGCGYGSESGW